MIQIKTHKATGSIATVRNEVKTEISCSFLLSPMIDQTQK